MKPEITLHTTNIVTQIQKVVIKLFLETCTPLVAPMNTATHTANEAAMM
jgi:hypothetical protein